MMSSPSWTGLIGQNKMKPLTAEQILNRIKAEGLDEAINNIDPETIEDHVAKIICRTIRQSKIALIERLEDLIIEKAMLSS